MRVQKVQISRTSWSRRLRSITRPACRFRFGIGFSVLCSHKIFPPNGPSYMSSGPVSQHSGRDGGPRPAGGWPEWMDDPAYLALRAAGEDLDDPDLDEDLKDDPPPEADEGELAAEADRITGELAREAVLLARLGLAGVMAAQAASAGGRRGPGMPGSAARVPGISVSRAAGFASAMPLDVAPGCLELAWFAEDAAGPDDRYRDASDEHTSELQ